jgi:hypothetical protein
MTMRCLLAVLALFAGIGCAAVAPSPPPGDAALPAGADAMEIAALEKAFWTCDYVGTTHGVLAAPMAACKHVTDELKARKFGGSFAALMAWWRENKAVEHERLERNGGVIRHPGTI